MTTWGRMAKTSGQSKSSMPGWRGEGRGPLPEGVASGRAYIFFGAVGAAISSRLTSLFSFHSLSTW